jgi:lysophospholipase L1-like esterase
VVVVAPLWLVHALARTRPLDDGWARSSSAWRERSGRRSADGALLATARTGAVEGRHGPHDRGGLWRRRLVGVGAVAVLLVAGTVVRSSLRDDPPPEELFGAEVSMYAHEDEPWFPTHVQDMGSIPYLWDPFIGLLMDDHESETVRIVDHRRATYQPAGDPDLTVWYFGGSTMFGAGQRDDHTIPSVIARLAEADGTVLRSVNFGVSSFVNWQETQLMIQQLQVQDPPDLVVFYDGINEEGIAYERVGLGETDLDAIGRGLTGDAERGLWQTNRAAPTDGVPDTSAVEELASRQYRRGVDLARRVLDSYDVEVVHVWQPSLMGKPYQPADRGAYEAMGLVPEEVSDREASRRILAQSGTGAVDLSRVFDEVTVPVYWDGGHTNERGARIVGSALYEHLRPTLERLAAEP